MKYKLNVLMKIVIALAVNILCFSFSNAHDIHTSELRVIQYDSVLHLELRLNAFELEFLGGREISKNGVINWDRFSDEKQRVINKLKESLILELNNKLLDTDKTGLTVDDTHHLIYRAHYYLPENQKSGSLKIESKLREFTSRSHVTRVSFNKSEQQENAQLEGDRNSVEFELVQKYSNEKNEGTNSKSTTISHKIKYAILTLFISIFTIGIYYKMNVSS